MSWGSRLAGLSAAVICTARASSVHLEDVDQLAVAGLCLLNCLLAGAQGCLAALHGAGLPTQGGLLGQVHRLQRVGMHQPFACTKHITACPLLAPHCMLLSCLQLRAARPQDGTLVLQ